MLSVIIPACNEQDYIGRCLGALFASDPVPGGSEVIVVANGCTDDTANRAGGFADLAAKTGWHLQVINLAEGGKPGALTAGDAKARGALRAYLDADVTVSPGLMAQIATCLAADRPIYATGTPRVARARSAVTRAYARFWLCLPFARSTAPGFGLFATNTSGRARWAGFPTVISDDTYVRLLFAPSERIQTAAAYDWPMIEGFSALIRVRRRQDAGVAEIARLYPALLDNEAKPGIGKIAIFRLALADPIGFATYAAVSLAVRLGRNARGWTRGR